MIVSQNHYLKKILDVHPLCKKQEAKNAKICDNWLKLEFQLPKDLVLELTGKYFGCSEHVSWKHIGILPSLHFSEQRLMHRLQSTIMFSKMLRLKSLLENLIYT